MFLQRKHKSDFRRTTMEISGKETKRLIEIDEKALEDHLGNIVRGSVEETLNALLDEEADRICKATRYEHSPDRVDTRAGSYSRKLETRAGTVNLKVPKLRKLPFESAVIERYRRKEISVEEAMIEMYVSGVSVRRVEDITEALWGSRVSAGTVSNLNKKIYRQMESWRNRALEVEYPYVYLDGMVLKRTWGGEVRNLSVLIAFGVNRYGFREILGVMEGIKEDKPSWERMLKNLKERGLKGVRLFISDRNMGLVESVAELFPDSRWQRCVVHYYRNVFSYIPRGKMREVSVMLKAIHAQENKAEARAKAEKVADKLKEMKFREASEMIRKSIDETLSYMEFPEQHWKRIRTNNPMERVIKEIRRRTKVVGAFPDGESALALISARLRHIAYSEWGSRMYLNIDDLIDMEREKSINEEGSGAA
jgi:transposase-like protein